MYYTIRLRDLGKQLWDVIKYTNIPKTTAILLVINDPYTYNHCEIIKKSLSYNDATNLVTILRKLNPEK